MDNKKYLFKSYSGTIVEDSYDEGEIGGTYHDFDVKVGKTYNTKKELIKAMNEIMSKDYKESDFDWEAGEGKSIQTDVLVSFDSDGNFFPASDSEKEQWKKGKKKLYSCHYWFYVTPIVELNEYAKGGIISRFKNWLNEPI